MSGIFASRLERARVRMRERRIDVLMVGASADLRYLAGYDALPLERLTLLVLPADGEAVLIVPALERPRAEASPAPSVCHIEDWNETEDPIELVRKAVPDAARRGAAGDRLWTTFLLRIQAALPGLELVAASAVTAGLRARKDAEEVEALRRAARVADEVALTLREERVVGRSEREVSRAIGERLLERGCERVNFAIVASGPNAASPHHEPGLRRVEPGDSLVCDFGGTLDGYCSDITRTFCAGPAEREFEAAYAVLAEAQQAAVEAVRPGTPAEAVDAAAREVIAAAGYGERFVHRTGHGIGLEEHEAPWIVAGNAEPLAPGMAFSVEPGIYVPGRFGMRIEDIVVVTEDGCERLNRAPRDAVVLA